MREQPWWNTSAGLLKKYPKIGHSEHWSEFARHYDKTECCEHRRKMWRKARPVFLYNPSPQLVRDLAETILGNTAHVMHMPHGRIDGTWEEGIGSLARDEAAERLANITLSLLSDRKHMTEFFAEARGETNRKGRRTNIETTLLAFCYFIKRTDRLPTKKELDVEANRYASSTVTPQATGGSSYGDEIKIADNDYRIYSRESYRSTHLRVCPSDQWDTRKWGKDAFYDTVVSPAGFTGLAEDR